MKIQKRTNLVMQFSSFLCLKEESSSLITYWKIIPELERSIRQLLEQQQIVAENDDLIAQEILEWLRKNQDNLKTKHLIAYLQESCFFATKKIYQRFRNFGNLFTWQDFFQWANLLLASPTQLLAKYNRSHNYKLTTYARSKIEANLVDQVYQYMRWERASDWGLLRHLKTGSRRKCLQIIGGLRGNDLEKYLLVWECFNLFYSPKGIKKNQKLPPPSSHEFLRVSEEYNFICQKQNLNLPSLTQVDCQQIIHQCIQFARSYSNPQMINSSDSIDYLNDNFSGYTQEQKEGDYEEYSQVNLALREGFSELNYEEKILLYLWKGLELTQTEIAEIMAVNYQDFIKEQYQVTRQISLTRKKLLEKLIKEIFSDAKIHLNQQKIKELKHPLDHWLKEYCQDFISEKIMSIYQSLSSQEKLLIKEKIKKQNLNYSSELSEPILALIANNLKTLLSREYQLVFPHTKYISTIFMNTIEDWFINNTSTLISL